MVVWCTTVARLRQIRNFSQPNFLIFFDVTFAVWGWALSCWNVTAFHFTKTFFIKLHSNSLFVNSRWTLVVSLFVSNSLATQLKDCKFLCNFTWGKNILYGSSLFWLLLGFFPLSSHCLQCFDFDNLIKSSFFISNHKSIQKEWDEFIRIKKRADFSLGFAVDFRSFPFFQV